MTPALDHVQNSQHYRSRNQQFLYPCNKSRLSGCWMEVFSAASARTQIPYRSNKIMNGHFIFLYHLLGHWLHRISYEKTELSLKTANKKVGRFALWKYTTPSHSQWNSERLRQIEKKRQTNQSDINVLPKHRSRWLKLAKWKEKKTALIHSEPTDARSLKYCCFRIHKDCQPRLQVWASLSVINDLEEQKS